MSIPFVLASASPARKKLLQTAGIEPLVCQSN
ncbi:MAG: Maf family protein, partial [Xenococcaceae cyanobacterium MO_234.B1]|nr:Maf family protein [Xenococcaceae cyanobacterium MO_234.B1]